MDALDLIQLGRLLVRIGETALRGGRPGSMPTGPTLVLRDVFAHPDSTIKAIADRTALPQSYVSESVARLREGGLLETRTDTGDKRRTLVRVTRTHRRTVARKGGAPIEDALAAELADAGSVSETAALLESLAARFAERARGPVMAQLRKPPESPDA